MLRSLGNKVVLLLVGFALVLCAVAITVSHKVINRMNEDSYRARADEVAALVGCSLDTDDLAAVRDEVDRIYHELPVKVGSDAFGTPEFDDYVAHYARITQMPEFKRTLAALSRLQGSVNVDCLYTAYVEPNDGVFVYLVDAAEEDACPPGTIDPIFDINRAVIDDPARGFPAYVTDTDEYGWLVTAGVPVYGGEGELAGFALVDVSMEDVKDNQRAYVWTLSWLLLGITCVLGIIASLLVRRFVTAPLNTLSEAAAGYRAAGAEPTSSFASLEINTGDEIETLHKSMVTMEKDIDTYIESLLDTETKLARSRRHAETMSDLARTDALTGARNRLAFDQAIAALDMSLAEGQDDFGIAVCDLNDLKVTNDTYGHECGNAALVRLVGLLRETFAHSAIYRIGGDEFAIVLVDADYAAADELVAAFEDKIAALQTVGGDLEPWERVSAAIGYASPDAARDSDATDVFGRADHAMYLRKREMKGEDTVR